MLVAALIASAGAMAQSAIVVTEHVRAELVLDAAEGIAPGKPVWLGLKIDHAPGWHTYWKNPGDSGLPTSLSWTLPAGMTAQEIAWPTPKALPFGPLTNYGYDGALLLPVPVEVRAMPPADAATVRLHAEWLVCEEICIPEAGEFELSLPLAGAVQTHAADFDAARDRFPIEPDGIRATSVFRDGGLAVSVAGLPSSLQGHPLQFFSESPGVIDHAAPIAQEWDGAQWDARIPLSPQRSESPTTLHAVLTTNELPAGTRIAIPIDWASIATTASPATPPATGVAAPTSEASSVTWWVSLALAFVGGALLNLMPCVFPVLALKVLSFSEAHGSRRSVLAGGVAYSAGVILAFVALASLLLLLRAGGEQLGWGFQLQSPIVITALAGLFTLIGLNLAGMFEFGSLLPNRWATARARHPLVDDALTGALAVAIASPCTAPFMGVAVGAALAGPPAFALLVFVALGAGMATPYLLLSAWPALANRLPRPGVWMQRFKQVMAFPMFATVVWLLWVLGHQVGIDGLTGALALLVALAFAAWALGTPGFGSRTRFAFGMASFALLVVVAVWAGPGLRAEPPVQSTTGEWQPWSTTAVAEARDAGRPVFIDFTAAWCITCQLNKRTTLSDPLVLDAFARHQVQLLRADWTRRDPAITEALNALGRSGVPVYVLYRPGVVTAEVLPTLLRVDELQRTLSTLPVAPDTRFP